MCCTFSFLFLYIMGAAPFLFLYTIGAAPFLCLYTIGAAPFPLPEALHLLFLHLFFSCTPQMLHAFAALPEALNILLVHRFKEVHICCALKLRLLHPLTACTWIITHFYAAPFQRVCYFVLNILMSLSNTADAAPPHGLYLEHHTLLCCTVSKSVLLCTQHSNFIVKHCRCCTPSRLVPGARMVP